MSSGLYNSREKYYVIESIRDGVYGPMTFRDAVQWQRDSEFEGVIVKVVINEEGREVK